MVIKENGLKVIGDIEDFVKFFIMKLIDVIEEVDLIILFIKVM